jgi:hypothetical protein
VRDFSFERNSDVIRHEFPDTHGIGQSREFKSNNATAESTGG